MLRSSAVSTRTFRPNNVPFRSARSVKRISMTTNAANNDVALLGVGLMGTCMVKRLAAEGFNMNIWNRSPEKAEALAGTENVAVHKSDIAAVSAASVVLLMLADAASIEKVVLAPDMMKALAGKIVVQMGTIGPQDSQRIHAALSKEGISYIEAPVLGSLPEASAGTLIIMVGAESDPTQSSAWPVLLKLGPNPEHIGGIGQAAAVKLAMNQLIASLTVGFSQSLALSQRNDVDVEKFMKIVRASALYAPTYDKKLQRMLDGNFANPNFSTKHLLKDVRLFKEAAAAVGVDTRVPASLEAVVESTCARGLDNTDYSAVYDAVLKP